MIDPIIGIIIGIIIIILGITQLILRWKIKQLEDKLNDRLTFFKNSHREKE